MIRTNGIKHPEGGAPCPEVGGLGGADTGAEDLVKVLLADPDDLETFFFLEERLLDLESCTKEMPVPGMDVVVREPPPAF